MKDRYKIFVDTNSLRAIPFNGREFALLATLSKGTILKFVLPYFVFKEFERQKRNEFATNVKKFNEAYNDLIQKMKNFEINLASSDKLINLERVEEPEIQKVEKAIRKKLAPFEILEKPSIEIFENSFNNYFNLYGCFEKSDNPRNHIPDSLILEEIEAVINDDYINVFVTGDKKISEILKNNNPDIVLVKDFQSFFDLEFVKKEIENSHKYSVAFDNLVAVLSWLKKVKLENLPQFSNAFRYSPLERVRFATWLDQTFMIPAKKDFRETAELEICYNDCEFIQDAGEIYIDGTYFQDIPVFREKKLLEEGKHFSFDTYQNYIDEENSFFASIDMGFQIRLSFDVEKLSSDGFRKDFNDLTSNSSSSIEDVVKFLNFELDVIQTTFVINSIEQKQAKASID